jgi:hypothetical protein
VSDATLADGTMKYPQPAGCGLFRPHFLLMEIWLLPCACGHNTWSR